MESGIIKRLECTNRGEREYNRVNFAQDPLVRRRLTGIRENVYSGQTVMSTSYYDGYRLLKTTITNINNSYYMHGSVNKQRVQLLVY